MAVRARNLQLSPQYGLCGRFSFRPFWARVVTFPHSVQAITTKRAVGWKCAALNALLLHDLPQ